MHNAGLVAKPAYFLVPGVIDMDPNTSSLPWLMMAYIVFFGTSEAIGLRSWSLEQLLDKIFGGFASLELLVYIKANSLDKNDRPD